MKIITDIDNIERKDSVATIGFFDGMHAGHQFLAGQVVRVAQEKGMDSMLISFDRHPRQVMQADYRPLLLSPYREKCNLLQQTQADKAVLLHFDLPMADLSAYDFMRCILRDRLQVRVLIVGYDHHFGKGASDSFEDYVRYGKELGIEVMQAEEYTGEGAHISSSAVRRALLRGDVDFATAALQRFYSLQGEVVHGFHIGTGLGFPTANLKVGDVDKLVPADGVYAVWVYLTDGTKWPGMLNIGQRPTMNNGCEVSIEVHLIGFSGNLYCQNVEVRFVKYLRPEQRFANKDELVKQLQDDRTRVEKVLLNK